MKKLLIFVVALMAMLSYAAEQELLGAKAFMKADGSPLVMESDANKKSSNFVTTLVAVNPGDTLEFSGEVKTKMLSPKAKNCAPATYYVNFFDSDKRPCVTPRRWLLNTYDSNSWKSFSKVIKIPEDVAYIKLSFGAWNAHVRSEYRNVKLVCLSKAGEPEILLSNKDFLSKNSDKSYLTLESDPQKKSSNFTTGFAPVSAGDVLCLEGEFKTKILSPTLKNATPTTYYIAFFDEDKQPCSPARKWLLNSFASKNWKSIKKLIDIPEGVAYVKISLGAWEAHVHSEYRNFKLTKLALPSDGKSVKKKIIPNKLDKSKLTPQAKEVKCGTRSSISLGGVWGFKPVYKNIKNNRWESIKVPAFWGNVKGFVQPKKWADALSAVYERSFVIPKSWQGERISVYFGAVQCKAKVFVNSKFVGEHLGSYTPFQFDITKFLKKGENDLTVEVDSPPVAGNIAGNYIVMNGYAASYRASNWWAGVDRGGIWQDVKLLAEPQISTRNPYVITSVTNKAISAEVTIEKTSKNNFAGTLKTYVVANKNDLTPIVKFPDTKLNLNSTSKLIKLAPISWKNPKLWSPANPNLYFIVMDIVDNNNVIDRSFLRFGFREFCVKGKNFYLNGEIYRLRGESLRPDNLMAYNNRQASINLMTYCKKDLNLNTLRYHCMMPDPIVLEAADEVGMLLDIQTALVGGGHRGGYYLQPGLRKILMKNLTQEYTEWVLRDRNHPSLVIWNIENEMYSCFKEPTAPITIELEKVVRKLDNTRVITRAGCGGFDGKTDELINAHGYDGFMTREIQRFAEKHVSKPYVNTEFWANLMPQRNIGEKVYQGFDVTVREFGNFFKEYLEYQRARNVAAIYPFMVTSYLYGPYCYRGTVRFKWDSKISSTPQPDYAASYIPLGSDGVFNPGNFPDKPYAYAHKSAIDLVSQAFKPLHIMLRNPNLSAWGGQKYNNTIVLVNDTEKVQKVNFSVKLDTQELFKSKTYNLKVGEMVNVPVALAMPKTDATKIYDLNLTLNNGYTNKYPLAVYPAAKANIKDKLVAVIGSDAQRKAYAKLGIKSVPFNVKNIKDYNLIIVASNIDTKELKKCSAQLISFIDNGGKILLNSQNDSIVGVFPGRINTTMQKVYFSKHYATIKGLPNSYYNQKWYVHGVDSTHPIWKNIPDAKLSNWNNEKLAVTTGSIIAINSIQGAVRPLTMDYKKRCDLLEYFYGKGAIIVSAIDFDNNIAQEPQAAQLLTNITEYMLDSTPRKTKKVAGIGAEIAKSFRVFDVEATDKDNADLLIFSADALDDSGVKNAKKALANGKDVFVFYNNKSTKFLKNFDVTVRNTSGRVIAFLNGKEDYFKGLSAFGFWHAGGKPYAVALDLSKAKNAKETASYVSMQAGWEYPYPLNHPFVPAYRCAAAELKVGKGKLMLFPDAVLKNARLVERMLFQSLITGLGGTFSKQVGSIPEIKVIKAKKVDIDGDLLEWTYDKTVEELIDYVHAEPIVLNSKISEITGSVPKSNRDSSGLIYFMYDDDYLYFATRALDDKLVFNQPPGLYYRADSLDFFVNSVQFQISVTDGKAVYTSTRNVESAKDRVKIAFKRESNAGSQRDMHLIGDDIKDAPGYIIEGKIPWIFFNEEGKAPKRFNVSAGINDCDDATKDDRDRQLYYPKGYKWNQYDTMAEATLE